MALIVRNIYKFILFFILNFLMFSFIYIYFNLEKSNFIFLFTRDWHTMSFVAETQSAPPPPPGGSTPTVDDNSILDIIDQFASLKTVITLATT